MKRQYNAKPKVRQPNLHAATQNSRRVSVDEKIIESDEPSTTLRGRMTKLTRPLTERPAKKNMHKQKAFRILTQKTKFEEKRELDQQSINMDQIKLAKAKQDKIDDGLQYSDEELVEEEDEASALEIGEKNEEETGDESAEDSDEEHHWLFFLFQELKSMSNYCEMEPKTRAREQIVASLSQHNVRKTEEQVRKALENLFGKRQTPLWMGTADREILKRMREKLERIQAEQLFDGFPWGYHLFQELVANPNYFEIGDNKRAREKLAASLRQKGIDRREDQVKDVLKRWIWREQTPLWISPADRELLENMRATARGRRGEGPHWTVHIFRKLVAMPDFFMLREKKNNRERIAASLRKKGYDKTEKDVNNILKGWILKKKTPRWMSPADMELLGKMRETAAQRTRTKAPSVKRRKVQQPQEDPESTADEEELLADEEDDENRKVEKDRVRQDNNSQVSEGDVSDDNDRYKMQQDDGELEGSVLSDRGASVPMYEEDAFEDNGLMAAEEHPLEEDPIEGMGQSLDDIDFEIPPASPQPIDSNPENNAVAQLKNAVNIRSVEGFKMPTVESLLKENINLLRQIKELQMRDEEKSKQVYELHKKMREMQRQKTNEVVKETGELPFTVMNENQVRDPGLKSLLELRGRGVVGRSNYEIHEGIGYGTFGVVFRAKNTQTKQFIALKFVVDKQVMENEVLVMMKMRKFGEMNRFICSPVDYFSDSYKDVSFTAFSMELLHVDLYSFVFEEEHEKKKFPSESILTILAQLFSALAFLNQNGIIYSDVKGENVMLKMFELQKLGDEEHVMNPIIRLIDFNCVREIDSACSLCQTAHLRAPEVILDLNFDSRIDTWSAGILALEIIDKDNFFEVEYGDGEEAKFYEHLALIEKALDKKIPNEMWEKSNLNRQLLPSETVEQPTVAEILDSLEPSTSSLALQQLVPLLLSLNPGHRGEPDDVLSTLKDRLPRGV